MKKYACNRLYLAKGEYISPGVVTINELGEVVNCSLLSEETSATEWIGGAIILSDRMDTKCATQPIYAWHIFPFDFDGEEPTEQSVIKRL